MTLTQILCFVTAAETRSFSGAGEKLFITRPAVSKQVAQLETELGFPLFIRVHGGLEITEQGQEAYIVFRKALDDINEVVSSGRQQYHRETGQIRIGYLWGWDQKKLFGPLMDELKRTMPELTISMEGYGFDMISYLKRGDLDYIICIDSPFEADSKVESAHLATIPGMLLYSVDRRQTDMNELSLTDFRDDTFFVSGESHYAEQSAKPLYNLCKKHGFLPRVRVISDGRLMWRIQSGQGVWIADSWFSSYSHSMVKTLKTDLMFNISIGWVGSKKDDEWNRSFIDIVTNFCLSHPLGT